MRKAKTFLQSTLPYPPRVTTQLSIHSELKIPDIETKTSPNHNKQEEHEWTPSFSRPSFPYPQHAPRQRVG